MKRISIRLEHLEHRYLLSGSGLSTANGFESDSIQFRDISLTEGVFGGPRAEDRVSSSEFLPRLHPESSGGLRPGPSLPVQHNSTNLQLTSGTVADGVGSPQPYLLVGQQIVLRAEWTSTNLAGSSYTVGFYFNGIRVDSSLITGVAGTASYWWYRYGSFASPGTHTLTIVVDPDNVVVEDNENDNSISFQITTIEPNDLPSKFLTPIGRTANHTWAINNYADVDPRANLRADYRNGEFQYDGHNALDAGPWGFSAQDEGIPIVAAADGIVDAVQDGFYDREITMGNRPGNFVRINHGNGFKTLYYHFATNTITVQVGRHVSAGELLGHMGSSGSSTATHIHYTPFYRDAPIETGYAPSVYNVNPLPYGGDVSPFFFETGITNKMVESDVREHISNNADFAVGSTGTLSFWIQAYNLKIGDVLQWRFYRPDGSLFGNNTFTLTTSYRFSWWYWNRSLASFSSTPGDWSVEFRINTSASEFKTFTISATGSAAIRVTSSGVGLVNSGRTTPIDYGAHSSGMPFRTYVIENHGTSPLVLGAPKLPPGFSLSGNFPEMIPAGGSAGATVLLNTNTVGAKFGAISFTTNDPDAPIFWFNVAGTVTGSAPADSIRIELPGPAAASYFGDLPMQIAPLGNITSSTPIVNFDQSTLKVEIDNVATGNEVLAMGSYGTPPLDHVASISGGLKGRPLLIQFTAQATLESVIRTLRGITYSKRVVDAAYMRRYIRFTFTDGTGNVSNGAIAHIIPGGRLDLPRTWNDQPTNFLREARNDLDMTSQFSEGQGGESILASREIQALAFSQIMMELDQERISKSRGSRTNPSNS